MNNGDVFYVFGYGSLIFAPELAEALQRRVPACLVGHRRSLNKLSATRYCAKNDSYDAFADAPALFFSNGMYRSMVLGTEPTPDAEMPGMLLEYPCSALGHVLRATDAREGYDRNRDSRLNGYVREQHLARRLDTDEMASCEVYLTNPDPEQVFLAPNWLTLTQRAKVLINATPRIRRGDLGLYYLEKIRESLRGVGIADAHLESLAATMRALPGPWHDAVYPPGPPYEMRNHEPKRS